MTDTQRAAPLDSSDRLLVDAIQRDGRASLTELASRIRLGVSATRTRLLGLEQRGVITGYTARVDPAACGFTLRAVVRMKVHGALYDKVADVLARHPQIVRCLRVTGEACYIAEVVAVDMPDLASITSELARVGSITTDLVYEVVADRPVPSEVPSSAPASWSHSLAAVRRALDVPLGELAASACGVEAHDERIPPP